MNDNPAADLIALKKTCKELQNELAYAAPDAKSVARLAEDARYLADCIKHWAKCFVADRACEEKIAGDA